MYARKGYFFGWTTASSIHALVHGQRYNNICGTGSESIERLVLSEGRKKPQSTTNLSLSNDPSYIFFSFYFLKDKAAERHIKI